MFKTYLILKIKKSINIIPKLLFAAIALFLIIGAIAFSSSKLFQSEKGQPFLNLGVTVKGKDKRLDFIISTIESSEDIKSIFKIKYMDERTLFKSLETGKISAGIIIPEGFLSSIIEGKNIPAKVITNSYFSMEKSVIEDLAESGQALLENAQVGVYAVIDFLDKDKIKISEEKKEQIIKDINLLYLNYTVSRNDAFLEEKIEITKDLNLHQYYLSSFFTLFLLMSGMLFFQVFKNQKNCLKNQLKFNGLGIWKQNFIDFLSGFGIFIIISSFFYSVIFILFKIFMDFNFESISKYLLSLILVTFSIYSIIFFVFKVHKNDGKSIITLFFLSISMVFCSGGIIPFSIMPTVLKKVSVFIPTRYITQAIGETFTNKTGFSSFIPLFVIGLIFTATGLIINSVQEEY